ncbi:MAG: TrmH family RNA methyltransferase [Actinomycetota bacterium]
MPSEGSVITSTRNPKVAEAVRLKKRGLRDGDRRFLAEGSQVVGELLASGATPELLFATDPADPVVMRARDADVRVEIVSDPVMERLTSTVTPPGLVAVVPFIDVPLKDLPANPACVPILCTCRDPGNAGTVVRSADAAGADAVIFAESSVDAYNPKTVRATAGSLFHLPVIRGASIADAVDAVRARGCRVLAASADGETDVFGADLAGPVAFLFGNEAWGLPPEVAELADAGVRVPLSGRAESLNLAAAATVCLFEWARQNRSGPEPEPEPESEPRAATPPGGPDPELAALIAAAAHDLRSPVAGIRSFAGTLLHGVDEQTQRALIEGIAYDADRADLVVQQLVDAARLAAGTLEPAPEAIDVADVVTRLAGSLGANPDHPEVRWDGPGVEAAVDRARLRSALAACIEAEVWHATDGPIVVSGERTEDRVTIRIHRDGSELADQAAAEQLFAARHPGEGGGSKLGLYVARSVAEAFGGGISARTDAGLWFVLEYPVLGGA